MHDLFVGFVGFMAGWAFYEWIGVVVCGLLLLPFIERGGGGRIFFTLLLMLILAFFATNGAIIETVRQNPITTCLYILGYFVVGGLWSLFKWDRHCAEAKANFDARLAILCTRWKEALDEHKNQRYEHGGTHRKNPRFENCAPEALARIERELAERKVPDELLSAFQEEFGYREDTVPSVVRSKEEIMTWILFWPWSFVNYFLFKLLSDIAEWIWRALKALYVAIANRHYKEVDRRLMGR